MSSSWHREVATMPNSLWQFWPPNQEPLENHVPRGILEKEWKWRWNLFEDLAEKTIQREPTNESSRNSNPISSKGDLYSIESSITAESKIATLMRRLEALDTREPVPVNQVSPNLFLTSGCTYYQAMNYVFEECPIFQAQQMCPDKMNAAFTRPNDNLYAQTYNPGWRNHLNFSWSQNNHDHSR